MEVTYYYGCISKFDKLNVHTISPHKIIFSKYGYDLLVLHYDDTMKIIIYILYQMKKNHLLLVL